MITIKSSHDIVVYSSTPYICRDDPEKMVATLKVHKWHAQNVYVRVVKGLCEPDQALSSASMSYRTDDFTGEHR